ncbi:DUF1345 domain-containing protein [Pedobacter sp. L105]|uniref:DUF1345 domain-containing protein n=1 Tax=Pedobacter sp. L105 TaxID=1641871 RepID=UPI001C20525F|nr:DUF1345 domain-containing protein [Pedobacter sp. L105]
MLFSNIKRLSAHHKLFISLFVALIIFGCSYGRISTSSEIIISWLGYALTTLFLSWLTVFNVHPIEMKKIAKGQDSSGSLIFFFVLTAALVSLFVVILLLRADQHLKGNMLTLHVLLSVVAVICSWTLVHTIFIFKYAHIYYEADTEDVTPSDYLEGLDFPQEKEPDYLDFAYFSFVIGMTFQVSDVVINSKRIRHLALAHSLVSFAFNTVIVALSINIISSLMAK